MQWQISQAIADCDHRTHGSGAPRSQGLGPGGSPICYCACVWCSWWVDQPLGHAVGAVCHIMVVNFNNINISWQPIDVEPPLGHDFKVDFNVNQFQGGGWW